MHNITVTTQNSQYPIIIGEHAEKNLSRLIRLHAAKQRLFIVADAGWFVLHGKPFLRFCKRSSGQVEPIVIPSGEKFKTQKTVDDLHSFLVSHQVSRYDFLLAVGGGVTTDIAGFTASTVLRGIRWGAVPTTLLGMVDASIGGKTGVNHAHGKNLIGTIWQPQFVLADLQYLQTLPIREIVAGYGEILKYAGLIGGPMIPLTSRLLDGKVKPSDWAQVIRQSARYKAALVSKDEREESVRAYLNLGHTFAHAIEQTLGYGKLLHGEAVTVGLLGAICLSMLVDPKSVHHLKEYYRLMLSSTELLPRRKLSAAGIINAMSFDKKRIDRKVRFVLLKAPGKPYLAAGLPPDMVTFAVEQMIADYQDFGGKYAPHSSR